MIRTYTIADENTGATVTGVYSNNIAETIRPWFDGEYETVEEVLAVVSDLQDRVSRGEYYGDQEAYLGVRVTADNA